jgi:hypothetical protein
MEDDDQILTPAQRLDLAAAAGIEHDASVSDADLLTLFAEKIDMSGELAIDPEGVLELGQDDVLVSLGTVPDEDRELADHPDLLHLSIMLRPGSAEEQTRLEEADLLEPGEDRHGEDNEWVFAWWGSLCTQLPRDTGIAEQLKALHRVMMEAQQVVERGDVGDFFERIQWLRHDDDLDDEIEVEIYDDDDEDDEEGRD